MTNETLRSNNIPQETQAMIDAANARSAAAERSARDKSALTLVLIAYLLGGLLAMTLINALKTADIRQLEQRVLEVRQQNVALRRAVARVSFFWMDTGGRIEGPGYNSWIARTLEIEESGCPTVSFIKQLQEQGIGTEAYTSFGYACCPGTIERTSPPASRPCPTP